MENGVGLIHIAFARKVNAMPRDNRWKLLRQIEFEYWTLLRKFELYSDIVANGFVLAYVYGQSDRINELHDMMRKYRRFPKQMNWRFDYYVKEILKQFATGNERLAKIISYGGNKPLCINGYGI